MEQQLVTIFLTGLFAGGISCMVLQGGLFSAAVSGSQIGGRRADASGIFSFLLAKVLAYSLLGALLGWAGSLFTLSVPLQIFLQLFVIFFMLATILGMITNYPLFSYFYLKTPEKINNILTSKFLKQSRFFFPTLGALTVFLPCGVTQAMMAFAVASGHPVSGALILFAYSVGTSPLFFFLGMAIVKLPALLKGRFVYVSAFGVFVLLVINANNTLSLLANGLTFSRVARNVYCIFSVCSGVSYLAPVATETITIANDGYVPGTFAVRAGSRVTLHLVNQNATNCTQAFTIPTLGLQATVPLGTEKTVIFTAPKKPGMLSYMCSQGNYVGEIQVL